MKPRISLTAGRKLSWLAPLVALVLMAAVAGAADRLLYPDDMDLPFYLRGLGHSETADGIWVGTVFYRPFETAPGDIAVNQFVFGIDPTDYPLYVEGFVIRKGPPPSAPMMMMLQNRPNEVVEIVFVRGEEYLAAWADGKVTIDELRAMPSLIVGYADAFLEIQQPADRDVPGVGFNHDVIASGVLEDGRSFFVRSIYTGSGSDYGVGAYNVEFRFGD